MSAQEVSKLTALLFWATFRVQARPKVSPKRRYPGFSPGESRSPGASPPQDSQPVPLGTRCFRSIIRPEGKQHWSCSQGQPSTELGVWGNGNAAITTLTPLAQLLARARVKQEEKKSQLTQSMQVNAGTQTFGGVFPFFQVSRGLLFSSLENIDASEICKFWGEQTGESVWLMQESFPTTSFNRG